MGPRNAVLRGATRYSRPHHDAAYVRSVGYRDPYPTGPPWAVRPGAFGPWSRPYHIHGRPVYPRPYLKYWIHHNAGYYAVPGSVYADPANVYKGYGYTDTFL